MQQKEKENKKAWTTPYLVDLSSLPEADAKFVRDAEARKNYYRIEQAGGYYGTGSVAPATSPTGSPPLTPP